LVLLKQLLPPDLLKDTEIAGMSDWYSTFSVAETIMSERSRPVILIVDANSDNPAVMQERQHTLEGLLLPAASAAPYQVCIAVPTLATIGQTAQVQPHPLLQQITQFLQSSHLTQAA
jgi:hypothetical protein